MTFVCSRVLVFGEFGLGSTDQAERKAGWQLLSLQLTLGAGSNSRLKPCWWRVSRRRPDKVTRALSARKALFFQQVLDTQIRRTARKLRESHDSVFVLSARSALAAAYRNYEIETQGTVSQWHLAVAAAYASQAQFIGCGGWCFGGKVGRNELQHPPVQNVYLKGPRLEREPCATHWVNNEGALSVGMRQCQTKKGCFNCPKLFTSDLETSGCRPPECASWPA